MHLREPSSPRMAKSTSLGVLEKDADMHIVDKEDILGLTQDVKNFSDGLGRLKELFSERLDGEEDLKVLAHERLGEVLCTLKSVLQSYPPLNTTELFTAAGDLITKIKGYNYEEHSVEAMEGAFNDAIDQLALEFSSSVSEYLMGDLQHGVSEEVKTKSYDNLMSVSQESGKEETEEEKEEPVVRLTPEQIDSTLLNLQAGLELAFQRAKAWSKYLKDVMSYIERRAQLEVEYSKNLSRLATSVKPALTEEGFLPLQSVYCTVLSQDIEYSKTCQATFTLLQTTKFLEPLSARRNEHDKTRKLLKETWNKEVKKMQESVNNLRKAQTLYVTRQQEYEKAKELSMKTESDMLSHSTSSSSLSAKIDKKRKAEDDASHKAAEAETTYKACVAEANNRQAEIQRIKSEHLAALRDQIFFSDQVIKKVTIDYFQLLQTVSAPVPIQYHTLCEASKRYEAGSQYGEYVRRLPVSSSTAVQYDEFKFEPYSTKEDLNNRKVSTQSNESEPSDHQSGESSPNLSSPRRQDKYRVPVRGAWTPQGIVGNSDTDSQSGSSKSLDSSPSNSPYTSGHKKMVLTGSMDDLIEDSSVPSGVKQLLAVPGTDQLDVQSIVKRQGRRRNTTFGVDFQEQVEHYHSAIPPIITKCLKEVEKRGINVKGIYRVSGVKSTVENLCQKFESDPESVNLDAENPNVISNVLKLYLRQLPEPLLTFRLYQNFIHVAKDNMSGGTEKEQTVEKLHGLIDKLPFSNRKTCGVLMHHLQRIANHADQNQMNSSNLGIVFGPTLLRPQGGNASLASLVDTPHQTRVVELLIVHAESLFGPREDHQLIPAETPVELLDKRNTLKVPLAATIELSPAETAMKYDVKKEMSPTISLSPREQFIPPRSPGSLRNSTTTKKPGEDILLPGSANIDKKETSSSRAHSDGEENEVENGVDHGLSTDSDLSDDDDDDILLPDDSHRSKHGHDINRLGGGAIVKEGDHRYMTPPLTTRRKSSSLRSPASSPNLSVRSAISSPPTIKIEDSFLEFPDGASATEISTNESEDSSASANRQKVFQLPPINSWVPKGESLFTSILDSRSPQVYRRTTVPTGKTMSYPPSPQNDLQSSRVSWPQVSQIQPLEQTPVPDNTVSNTTSAAASESSKTAQSSKSPKLLRKCTSFDLERSRPFPARSKMSSPMLVRKNASVEEFHTIQNTNQDLASAKSTRTDKQKKDSRKIVHKEDDESDIDAEAALKVPQCESKANLCLHDLTIDTMAGDNSVQYLMNNTSVEFDAARINESLEDPSIPETDILDDDYVTDTSKHSEEIRKVDLKMKGKTVRKSEEKDKGAKTKKSQNYEVSGHVGKKDSSKSSKKLTDSKDSPKTPTTKTDNIKTSKQKESRSSEKSRSKTPASTVKSALLTSAAKLKSIGKRSPVTLLSYKSHSISIPDHSRKVPRPSSTSELEPAAIPKTGRIHQTESSPTVLVTSHDSTKEYTKEQLIRTRSKTPPPGKSGREIKQKTVEKAEEQKKVEDVRKSSSSKSTPRISLKKTPADSQEEKKVKLVPAKSTSDKLMKGSQSKPNVVGKQSKELKASQSSMVKAPGTVRGSSLSQQKTKKQGKDNLAAAAKEEKPKVKPTAKRGSISSVNSDSLKATGHFHDCCHGRRKMEKK